MTGGCRGFLPEMMLTLALGISDQAMAAEAGSEVTVSGGVIDSACAYTKGLAFRCIAKANECKAGVTRARLAIIVL